MSVYDKDGNVIATLDNNVNVSEVKKSNPTYNDDQVLAEAITEAKKLGKTSVIMWDGKDIYFSGTVTHECKGFGGINFNGSKIHMPDYNGGTIINVVPDTTEDVVASASSIYNTHTTNTSLKGKIFAINEISSGNADMCLGYRYGDSTEIVLYSVPIVKTSLDGKYETGELYLTPESGNVNCYNVHEYPDCTFDICNGAIIASETTNMSVFVKCTRSNTHIHNFVLQGRSNVTSFNWGVFNCINCVSIEVDHISGTNPIQREKTSGYFLSLSSVGFCHVHDVMVGDSIGWGAVGCRYLTGSVFERCYLNRWDCHFAQFGTNVVRDCVLNAVLYSVGNGVLSIDDSTLLMTQTSADVLSFIALRPDVTGAFDGDITVKNCKFISDAQLANLIDIWSDSCTYAKPSNSKVTGSPKRNRIIDSCQFIENCKSVFVTGTTITADMAMFENLRYKAKDCIIKCRDAVIKTLGTGETVNTFVVDGCNIDGNITNAGISNFIAVGNVFDSAVSVSNFEKYAMYGNIATDMASANGHN